MRKLLLLLPVAVTSACFSAGYLAQAARGQLQIVTAARPIAEVVRDPATPARTRRLLSTVRSVREFGEAHGLRATRNYQRYADLQRPAAVWVVQASDPLAFRPKRWSFPVVGSIPYLGFFDEGRARGHAAELAAREGLDVDVRTAGAYSTLGWFRDPILSTMLGSGDAAPGDLADVVLHESVHATVYVNDQSAFDESLASFVADRLTPRWLASTYGESAVETTAWIAAEARGRARAARLHAAYEELDALYRSDDDDEVKRSGKARVLAALQAELRLARPLNNASLAGYRTYDTGTAGFERLLAACGGSWRRFLAAAGTLRPGDFSGAQAERFDDALARAAGRACGGPAAPLTRGERKGGATKG